MQAILQPEKTLYNAVIITMNPELEVIRNGYVTISGNTITEIGEGIPKNGKNMVDIQGDIIIPGFVNA
ncbi:MAG TPA: hypothetical protein DEQ03_10465, partial [Marinilabiliales bacterium]|nr:hypothetical protein [Marinilabiliales bacterium]